MPLVPPSVRALGRAALHAFLLVLLALSAACRTWREVPVPATGSPDHAIGAHVRATRADGGRVELTRARVLGDTLRGEPRGGDAGARRSETAIPLDGVRGLEIRRESVARTAWLGVGVLVAAFFVMSAAEGNAFGSGSR